MRSRDRPLRATVNDMAVAPELAILIALDAVLATTAHQLFVATPYLGADVLARGSPPDALTLKARALILHIRELRAALRGYRNLTLRGDEHDSRSF
jgi:hypothetical protein